MLTELISDISGRVERSQVFSTIGNTQTPSSIAFNDPRYVPIPFSEEKFQEIDGALAERMMRIAFIDGGNAELITIPGLSVQLIRAAAALMQQNKLAHHFSEEFFVVAQTLAERGTGGGGGGAHQTQTVQVTRYDLSGKQGKTFSLNAEKPEDACASIRKQAEISLAHSITKKEPGLIVMDGTLETVNEQEKEGMQRLYEAGKERGILISSVAKTCRLLTSEGYPVGAFLLGQNRQERCWHYGPLASIVSDHHQAELFFAKLHAKSIHVFRCEVYREQKEKIPLIAAQFREGAKDLTFPGYPYGMIAADRLARISERETEWQRTKLFAAAGKSWEHLRHSLSAVNAHDILDSM